MPTSTRRGALASSSVFRAAGRWSTVATSERLFGTICTYTLARLSQVSLICEATVSFEAL